MFFKGNDSSQTDIGRIMTEGMLHHRLKGRREETT